ncbi:M23 family metallopeptidase [Methanonatronarchaeum thermophilum]|uniref:M23 family metallopeptidase n=1 Tax=Methanonatronarchaeum thermophilum TaxID=1927129 RepID=UPI001374749D|nr:M23 family metallopeptidase [Methanonatronarchaeum thermophilum]
MAIPGWFIESAELLQIFALFFLLFLWPYIHPAIDSLLHGDSEARSDSTDGVDSGWLEWIIFYVIYVPTTFLNPLLMVQDAFQFAGSLIGYIRYKGAVPEADYKLKANYRLPVEGTWTVVNGGLTKENSHSWFPLTQRYAYDYVITDDKGQTHPDNASTAVEEYYCYNEPVLAPADGVVVDILDSDFESQHAGISHPLKRDIRGNYVTIQHASNEYSSLVHLVPGSIEVNIGDHVKQGQQIARCGHSGNSSEPHLHFQLQDSPTFETAAALPVQFNNIQINEPSHNKNKVERRSSRLPAEENTENKSQKERQELTEITAGQQITTHNHTETTKQANTDPHESISLPFRRVTTLLQRTGFGITVGALLTGISSLILTDLTITLLLSIGVIAGFTLWIALRLSEFVPRPGGLGLPLGIGLVALAWSAELLTGNLLLLVILTGFVLHVTVGEFDRKRLQSNF